MNPMNPREPTAMKGSSLKTAVKNGPGRVCMNLMNLFFRCEREKRGTPRGSSHIGFIRFIGSFRKSVSRGIYCEQSTVDDGLIDKQLSG